MYPAGLSTLSQKVNKKILKQMLDAHGLALLLMAAALAVRAFRFGDVPGGFNQDEAMAAYEAWSLYLYGTDRFGMSYPVYFTAWGFAQMNVLLSYAMLPFIHFLGLTAVAARLPALLVGMMGLYALYRFAHAVYGRSVSLVVLAFAGISPWHIMHSRWALESNLFPHLLMLAVWLLYDGCTRKPYKVYCSMPVFGLCMYAYGTAYISVPLLLLLFAFYISKRQILPTRKILAAAGVYLLTAFPIFALIAVNLFDLPTLHLGGVTIPRFPGSARMDEILIFSDNIFRQLLENLSYFINVVLWQNDPAPWNMLARYGTVYKWAMPFVLLGIFYLILDAKKPSHGAAFVLLWLATSCVTGAMLYQVNVTRINIIFYPLLLAGGLGIAQAVKLPFKLTKMEVQAKINHGHFSIQYHKDDQKAKRISRAVAIVVSVVMLVSFADFCHRYFRRYNDQLAYVFFDDFYQSLEYADGQGYQRLYVTAWTQYQGFGHVSEVLTLYGLRIDPALYQDRAAYHEIYHYIVFDAVPSLDPQAMYVFNTQEQHLFPPELFTITSFGGFGVAQVP
jgi:hypothetical protein